MERYLPMDRLAVAKLTQCWALMKLFNKFKTMLTTCLMKCNRKWELFLELFFRFLKKLMILLMNKINLLLKLKLAIYRFIKKKYMICWIQRKVILHVKKLLRNLLKANFKL